MQLPVPVPPRSERDRGLRDFLLLAFGFLAAVDAVLETLRGNWPVVSATATVAMLTPAVLVLSRTTRFTRLPEYYALVILSSFLAIAGFTQWHLPANLAWLPLYPFAFFFIGGLRIGTLLSALGGGVLAASYAAYPRLHGTPPVATSHFVQVLFAYGMAALIAFLYERVRTRQELLLVEQATQDFLTGLPNRRGFSQLADALARQAQRARQPLAVMLFDVDNFKQVNDRFGHPAGDALLRDAARLAQTTVRGADVVARWGGEEFIVLLPHCDLPGAVGIAEKLRHALGAHEFAEVGRITASFGLAEVQTGESLDTLIERADAALYRAKHGGKNRVETDPAR